MVDSICLPLIWFIVGLGFFLAELFIPALVLLFFGFGAFMALLGSLLIFPGLKSQLLLFIISSIAPLIFLRKKLDRSRRRLHAHDSFIGSLGILATDIKPGERGKVEVHGTIWNAEAFEPLKKGASVMIISKDNLTLIVEATN